MPNIHIRAAPKRNPVISAIIPGRRALGETWSKVNIYPDPATGKYIVEREDTPAPADNTPIFVPGLSNISVEMADFYLEYQRDRAQDRASQPRRSKAEIEKEINEAWHAYIEQKLAWLKGKSVSGPGGWTQRERL